MSPLAARRAGLATLAGLLGLGAAPPADLRTDLEAVGVALDRAVMQVSRPSRPTARGGARGYRIEGFGAMFVLNPRALPVPPPTPTAEEREIAKALSEAAQELEQRLSRVMSDDVRAQLQHSIRAMRQNEAELIQRMNRRAVGLPVAPEGGDPTAPRTLEQQLQDLERDVRMMQDMRSEVPQGTVADALGIPPELRQEFERQLLIFNQQAEAFAAEAERARLEAERDIHRRLGQEPPPAGDAPSAPPSSGTVPAPATQPPPGPASTRSLSIVMPPWHLWNDPMDDATPDPKGVIQGVGAAVTAVLEAHGARLRALAPQETVAVAVDFVPATRIGAPSRTARTLLVRAKKVDIDLRAAGEISPEEFRKRVELVEY